MKGILNNYTNILGVRVLEVLGFRLIGGKYEIF